jgi:para-nitrobenzyl esterase
MTLPSFPAESKPAEQLPAGFGGLAGPARLAYATEIGKGGLQLEARLFGDRTFVEPTRAAARSHAAVLAPVYRYRFSYIAAAERDTVAVAGAVDASEIPYVFGNLRARWIAFARTGAPQARGLPEWQRTQTGEDLLLEVDAQPQMRPDDQGPQLDVLEALAGTPGN